MDFDEHILYSQYSESRICLDLLINLLEDDDKKKKAAVSWAGMIKF